MKAYICDQCERRQQPAVGGADIPPTGWYTITQYDKSPYATHVCGVPCLVDYAQALAAPVEAVRPPQELPVDVGAPVASEFSL